MRDPWVCGLCSPPLHVILLIDTVPERFRTCGPYVRDVPGLDSRVCVHRSLAFGCPKLYIYALINILPWNC